MSSIDLVIDISDRVRSNFIFEGKVLVMSQSFFDASEISLRMQMRYNKESKSGRLSYWIPGMSAKNNHGKSFLRIKFFVVEDDRLEGNKFDFVPDSDIVRYITEVSAYSDNIETVEDPVITLAKARGIDTEGKTVEEIEKILYD